MSNSELITPLSNKAPIWSNLNVNSINVAGSGSSLTAPLTIKGNTGSGSPLLNIVETNPSPGSFNIVLQSYNQSGSASIKLVTQNDPSPNSEIWADSNFSINTFEPTSSIALNPNDSRAALVCSYVSPGQTLTQIQNLTTTGTLLLPTTGGTATNLSYYEEYTAAFGFTGPWGGGATTYTRNVNITRVGRIVTLRIDGINQTQNLAASILMTGSLPARFVPTATTDSTFFDFQVTLLDNGNIVNGDLQMSNTGGIRIFMMKYTGTAPFTYTNSTGTGNCGFNNLNISYSV